VRDGFGLATDQYMYPVRYAEDRETRIGLYLLNTVSLRAGLLEAGDIVDEAAYDPYIFLRELYLQRRRNLVYDGSPPAGPLDEEIDIFSDE
jgi:phospholipid-binding lipoprotein MlaA